MSNDIVIRFCVNGGDDPFICHVNGKATINALSEIEKQASEDRGDVFAQGDGYYQFNATYEKGQYGFEGRCEFPPYWELSSMAFEPFAESSNVEVSDGGVK